jgi:hypothetical protein
VEGQTYILDKEGERNMKADVLVVTDQVVVHHVRMLTRYDVIIVKSQLHTTVQRCLRSDRVMDTIYLSNLHDMRFQLLIPHNIDISVFPKMH